MGIWFAESGRYYRATHYQTQRGWEPLTGPIRGGWPARVGAFDPRVDGDDDDDGWREGPTPGDAVFVYRGAGGDYVILARDSVVRTPNLSNRCERD